MRVSEGEKLCLAFEDRLLLTQVKHRARARSIMMGFVNWVKLWKVNYVCISCYATDGWKNTSISDRILPTPSNQRTRHFQVVPSKVNSKYSLRFYLAFLMATAPAFYLLDPVNDLIQRNKRGFWKCILHRKKKKKGLAVSFLSL